MSPAASFTTGWIALYTLFGELAGVLAGAFPQGAGRAR